MSELTKLIAKIDLLGKEVESIKARTITIENVVEQSVLQQSLHQLTGLSLELNNLLTQYSKFESKLNLVDPVSGEKRYGAATEAKIAAQAPKLCMLQVDIDYIQATISPLISIAPQPQVVDKIIVMQVDTEAETLRLAELERQRLEKDALELELNRKAQVIRERKAQEQHQQEVYNKQVEDKLNSIKSFANTAGLDTATILSCIESYALEHTNLKKSVVEMLKTTSSIIDSIISRPDNIGLRKLRLTHPTLKVHCGIELLLSLGFQLAIVVVPSGSQPASIASQSIDKILNYSSNECPLETYTDILHLLTPNTKWDGVMEMEEPSVSVSTTTVAGKDDWIVWFDKLNADRELLSKTLKALQ